MPWLENFDPTINWREGTITEVLEVPLHLPKMKCKKCAWKEDLIEGPTTFKPLQGKESTDKMLITKLQERKLKSKEELEQELLNNYLEDLLCVQETQKQDPRKEPTSKGLGESISFKNQNNDPLSRDHCPEQEIRPGGEQDQDETQTDLTKLTTISPTKGESDDLWELTTQSQVIKPEPSGNDNLKVDKQMLPTSHEGMNLMRLEMYKILGIEEIPRQPNTSDKAPVQQRMPENFRKATKLLDKLKSAAAKAQERHKKGIKTSMDGTKSTPTSELLKPLPGLEDLEQLNDVERTPSPISMILEDHGSEKGQNAQRHAKYAEKPMDRPVKREVKHDLLDPSTQEDEHLDQEEVQGPERMVVEDHGPKKGMAPRLKPQINPLFFPFAMCLPIASALLNDYKGMMHKQSSAKEEPTDTESTEPTRWELESPWPNQWQLKELDNLMTAHEDLEPDRTEFPDDLSNWEIPDKMTCAPNTISWGTIGEPYWTPELDNAELELEEDPYPQTLHLLKNEPTLEGEVSPQLTINETRRWKETLSLRTGDKLEPRNNYRSTYQNNAIETFSSTSDNKEGTAMTNELANQRPKCLDKERTMRTDQTQPWKALTRQWSDTKQHDLNGSPMLQTSAHYT